MVSDIKLLVRVYIYIIPEEETWNLLRMVEMEYGISNPPPLAHIGENMDQTMSSSQPTFLFFDKC